MNYEALQLQLDLPIARLDLRRPERGNRIDSRLILELADACEMLRDLDDVRVVLLTAQGRDFCLGWEDDVFESGGGPQPDPFGCVAGLPQPVLAVIQGQAISAGLELALACDVRIAGDDARFALPESDAGRLPAAGGTQRLPRLVGRGRALAMLLCGEELDAAAAYRAGLVSKVAPKSDLGAAAEALAASIASRGPIALKYAKEAVHRGLEMTLEQALRYETDLTVILQTTEDRAEGVRAFLEGKRTPRFKGK
jgi:enoyl-CoA hydratase